MCIAKLLAKCFDLPKELSTKKNAGAKRPRSRGKLSPHAYDGTYESIREFKGIQDEDGCQCSRYDKERHNSLPHQGERVRPRLGRCIQESCPERDREDIGENKHKPMRAKSAHEAGLHFSVYVFLEALLCHVSSRVE